MAGHSFLRPRTIAVFGGKEIEELIRQCERMGFDGDIWPVHPTKDSVGGRSCFRSVADLPSAPDAAYLAVNRALTVELVAQLAKRGCGGAVCYATGFSEAGEQGKEIAKQLLVASGDMPLLGPNCYGTLNYVDGVMLWPDQQGGRRVKNGVAIITQSSNVAFNLTMQNKGLPIAYLQSLGTRLKYDLHDAIRLFCDEPTVTAIGLHIEGISNPQAFDEAARYARAKGKAIVAIKVGKSEAAQKIAMSHTATLTGTDVLMTALFKRLSIARVDRLEVFIEALKVLHVVGPISSRELGALSTSGGDCSLMADAAEPLSLEFKALGESTIALMKQSLHPSVECDNPLDYQMYDWSDEERLTRNFGSFLSNDFGFCVSLLDFPRVDCCDLSGWNPSKNAVIRAAKLHDCPVGIMSTLPENLPESLAIELIDQGVVPLAGIDNGLQAIASAVFIGESWHLSDPLPLARKHAQSTHQSLRSLTEVESKQVLESYGIVTPERRVARHISEAVDGATQISYPVAMKVVGVEHKTEVAGVELNIHNESALVEAYQRLAVMSEEILIESMVQGHVAEIIVGINMDELFGPVLVIGAGGVMVELLHDSASLLLPTTREDVLDALNGLKTTALFHGFRGQPKVDLEAAADMAMAVAQYALDHLDDLVELDVNPVMLLPEGEGAIAADALIRLKQ